HRTHDIAAVPSLLRPAPTPLALTSSALIKLELFKETPMLVAHITDTHITTPGNLFYGVVDTAVCLARAVAALNSFDPLPDLTVITGDLVDGGTPDEYAHLRSLLKPLRIPVFVIPGNHDAREPLRDAFVSDGYLPRQDFLNYVIEDQALRIVALDTLV